MVEYEKKVMLTYDEYSVLIKKLGHSVSTVIQTNYYFDNDDLSMNKNGITCRVRAKGGKYKATIKKHNMDSPDCSYETELTESKTFDPDAFKEFGLRCRGRLVTFRNEVSKDDEQAGESVSIETQKMMLVDYCANHNYDIYDIYIDDGFSGLNFNRPAFMRLLNDIDDGAVNLVITKDLSRLGRDYIQTGYYTDIYFNRKRVRYIAVNDGICHK